MGLSVSHVPDVPVEEVAPETASVAAYLTPTAAGAKLNSGTFRRPAAGAKLGATSVANELACAKQRAWRTDLSARAESLHVSLMRN